MTKERQKINLSPFLQKNKVKLKNVSLTEYTEVSEKRPLGFNTKKHYVFHACLCGL
jgi:hypothetical protein